MIDSFFKKFNQVDLLNGNIFISLLLFNIPIVISLVFQKLYNTIDTIIVGHYLGEQSLAAIGAASPFYTLLLSLAFGIGNGLSIVTARSFGNGNEDTLKKSVFTAFVIALGSSAVLMVLGQFCCRFFISITNTPADIAQETANYINILTCFIIVMMFYNLCSALLKAIGNSFMPLIFLMISSAMNIFLDVLFITNFGLGVKGAAMATVIAQAFSCFLCLIYIFKKVNVLVPEKKHICFDASLFIDMLELGLSLGIMNSVVSMGTVILQSSINTMGTYVIAAHTTARNIFSFTSIAITSLSNSMSTFTSQNLGAGKIERIRRAMKGCIIFSGIVSLLVTTTMLLFGRTLIEIISGSHNTTVLDNGSLYVSVMGPFYIFLGILACCRISLQALGSKILPLFSSGIEMAIKIIFAFIIIPIFHYKAVVICEPVAWTVMAVQLLLAFYRNPYIVESKRKEAL